ncbi:hypothetical protein CR513_14769, partial [Mucuna pruriens]
MDARLLSFEEEGLNTESNLLPDHKGTSINAIKNNMLEEKASCPLHFHSYFQAFAPMHEVLMPPFILKARAYTIKVLKPPSTFKRLYTYA